MGCPHVVGKRVYMYDCYHVTTLSGMTMACPHVVGNRVCMYDSLSTCQDTLGDVNGVSSCGW